MELYAYSPYLQLQGIIDEFSSLRWRRRYFIPGEFELHCPFTQTNINILAEGNILHRLDRIESGRIDTLIVAPNQQGNGDEIQASGRMLSGVFDDRVIASTEIYSGPVESAMRVIVSNHAITVNPIPFLDIYPTNGFPQTASFQVTGGSISDTIQALSASSNIGYRIRFDVLNTKLWFETYMGVDRSISQSVGPWTVFSDTFHNVTSPQYTYSSRGAKNYAYVAGEGTAGNRMIINVDQTNGDTRCELWVDARDLQQGTLSDGDYQAQLYQRGLEKLAVVPIVQNLTMQALPTDNFKYLIDWDLGDIVTFDKWGILLDQRITEIEEVYENGIVMITPTCGSPLSDILNLGGN